ncbi:hypothetical protein MJH12_07345, partial [bacterium]|nr:hypothetical protein [bacterium]
AYSYYLNPTLEESNQEDHVLFPMTYDSLLNFPYQSQREEHWKVFRYQSYLLSKDLHFNTMKASQFRKFITHWLRNDLAHYIYANRLE